MSPNEMDLRAALQDDAERIDASGDFASVAMARSRRTTRNRAALGAVAAAAAVAVTVPLLWSGPDRGTTPVPATTPAVATSTVDGSSAPPPTASSTTTATPTVTATVKEPTPAGTARPGPAPTHNSNLAQPPEATIAFGPATGSPQVAYAARGVFHDGTRTVRLPVATSIQLVARLSDGGVLVHAPEEGRAEPLAFVDSSGTVVARFSDVQGVVVSDAGDRVALSDGSGRVSLHDNRGRELAAVDTGDANADPSAILGDTVHVATVDGQGRTTTRAWDTSTRTLGDAVIKGRIIDVHEPSRLALVWPDQEYNPDNTCHLLVDLKTGETRYTSCGMFAPTSFTPDGQHVVGPEVADGAGASSWKVARVEDAEIVLKVSSTDGAWAPRWTAGPGSLVVALLDTEAATQQAMASCSIATRTCTVDTEPTRVTPAQLDSMDWPVVPSVN